MPPIDESCVLIPAATLEDFPADLSDYDARSLLAAWTVLWHPSLLVRTGRLPRWQRADAPPEPRSGLLLALPAPSIERLPSDYLARVEATPGCALIRGGSRAELLDQMGQLGDGAADSGELDAPPLATPLRAVGVADFYAAGYALLQIQVMTRRLRYTSNLDEVHLQRRAVDAATAFREGQADATAAALHDVFDLLAQERDHYFASSDPHLIELILATGATVNELLADIAAAPPLPAGGADDPAVLPTPRNCLLDQDVCAALRALPDAQVDTLRGLIAGGQLGWAGGGPSATTCLDLLTLDQADRCIAAATEACAAALGQRPTVWARFQGGWPGDLNAGLAQLGYHGVIPIDFAAGTGYGDEAKVILETGGARLEGLTAKPIDAASDASFLTLGTRLGEAIDSGEIATALLAHWPGHHCDSFADLRRAASWSLCLGRFWQLDPYFSAGEQPYHHGTIRASGESSAQWLETLAAEGSADPLSRTANEFCAAVIAEQQALISGLASLLTPAGPPSDPALDHFAAAISGPAGQRSRDTASLNQAILIVNPTAVGYRATVETKTKVATQPSHVFACTARGANWDVTVDVPGCGFVLVPEDPSPAATGNAISRSIRARLTRPRGPRVIAGPIRGDRALRLENEFMEVVISHSSGGIAGVYSGAVRGNRLSMKLVRHAADADHASPEGVMRCERLRIVSTTPAIGQIESQGVILDRPEGTVLADFRLQFRLSRGSRLLQVQGSIHPRQPIQGNPWHHYLAARTAVAGEAAIYRPLVRDKVHQAAGRRVIAPLGVLIDEAERQTLLVSHGLAAHRKVSERFLDTLLMVAHQSEYQFTLSYGFDVPAPIATARSTIAPAPRQTVRVGSAVPPLGWIMHASPDSVLVQRILAGHRQDGRRAAVVRLIQTRAQPVTAAVRFPHEVAAALRCAESVEDPLNLPLPDSSRPRLTVQGDRVTVPLAAHAVVDVLVVFGPRESSGSDAA